LAKIISKVGVSVNVEEPIAILVDDKDAYMTYFEEQKEAAHEKELIEGFI
jgi:hypothetical protein